MASRAGSEGSPSKRRKLDDASLSSFVVLKGEAQETNSKGLDRPISPPLSRRKRSRTPAPSTPRVVRHQEASPPRKPAPAAVEKEERIANATKYEASPVQLTRIRDLAPDQNVDAIGLGDILCDPMIRECWNFNYLFDIDFIV